MSAQVAADLRAAADVLERDGWGRDFFHLSNGCHCAEGAVAVATGYHFDVKPGGPDEISAEYLMNGAARGRYVVARDTLANYLSRRTDSASVPHWNDDVAKDAAEVIAALRAAADAAEADQ